MRLAVTAKDQNVLDFVASADAFCALIEYHNRYEAGEFVTQCALCLTALYRNAILLASVAVESDDFDSCVRMISADQWQDSCREIGAKLGKLRYYYEVFNPYEADEPLVGDLADDLTDIYSEVKDGLAAYLSGRETNAIIDWQQGFRTHWGDHLVDALRALHRILTDNVPEAA